VARARAKRFIAYRHPNPREADLIQSILSQPPSELSDFPKLVLFEWTPARGNGQGDAVFADGRGNLAVVEAKAKRSIDHVTRQSLSYANRLREELPRAKVYSAIVNDLGFKWTNAPPTDAEVYDRPSTASKRHSASESTAVVLSAGCRDVAVVSGARNRTMNVLG
jgi:hypothetical protein